MFVIGEAVLRQLLDFSPTTTHFYGPDISVNLTGKRFCQSQKYKKEVVA